MSQPIKGSCLCQAVKYQFHGPGYAFQYCHCSRCRKFTGSAHGSNIIIDPKNYPEAKHFATCFCRNCGSSLPWMSQSGISVVIPAGTLDEDPGIRPTQNIFWKSCAPWREEVSSLPHYDELPPRKDKS
jgi:hypothetical protein